MEFFNNILNANSPTPSKTNQWFDELKFSSTKLSLHTIKNVCNYITKKKRRKTASNRINSRWNLRNWRRRRREAKTNQNQEKKRNKIISTGYYACYFLSLSVKRQKPLTRARAHQFMIPTRIKANRGSFIYGSKPPPPPCFRSVTRRIFKKNPRSGAHEAPSIVAGPRTRACVLCSRFDCISWLPHTRANANAHKRAVCVHTLSISYAKHMEESGGISIETELFFDEISSRSMNIIVSPLFFSSSIFVFFFFSRDEERERDITLNSRNFSRGLSKKTISKEKKSCLLLWEFSSLIDLQLKYTYRRGFMTFVIFQNWKKK